MLRLAESGDDEENLAVERWARQCLNLPMVW